MSVLWLKMCAAAFIAQAVFAVMFLVLSKGEQAMIPWPVAIVLGALGLALLRGSRHMQREQDDLRDRGDVAHSGGASDHA